jgi:hypothetical protein
MIPWRRIAAACAALLTTALFLQAPRAAHRAHVSFDLISHEERHSSERTRVILHGTTGDAASIAERHHLQILKHLSDGVVVLANSDEVSELAGDGDAGALSGDVRVRTGMSVSNASTGADQTRAGQPGGLLGIGAIPGVNGQGVGVAVIDSGVSPHRRSPTALSPTSVSSPATRATSTPSDTARTSPASSPAAAHRPAASPRSTTAASRPARASSTSACSGPTAPA